MFSLIKCTSHSIRFGIPIFRVKRKVSLRFIPFTFISVPYLSREGRVSRGALGGSNECIASLPTYRISIPQLNEGCTNKPIASSNTTWKGIP